MKYLAVFVLAATVHSAHLRNGGSNSTATPVVIWHGMGDTCCNPLSLGPFIEKIEKEAGAYVHSLQFGDDSFEDTMSGFFTSAPKQIDMACEMIANDPKLKDGYHAVGLSQGGQFLRAVAQKCPNPPMKTLVSLGGQHQGVYGIPHCNPDKMSFICDNLRKSVSGIVYGDVFQSTLVQAQYWHDPLHPEKHAEKSGFIAGINNEGKQHLEYATNLKKLERLVLVKFAEDTMVFPRETSHFEFYADGSSSGIVPLNESKIYLDDRLGLKTLNEEGKIDFLTIPGDHLDISMDWFVNVVIHKYLV